MDKAEIHSHEVCTFDILDFIVSNKPNYINLSEEAACKFVGMLWDLGGVNDLNSLVSGNFGATTHYNKTPVYVENRPLTNINSYVAKYSRGRHLRLAEERLEKCNAN